MFFDEAWWLNATYPAPIVAYVITDGVLQQLKGKGFPARCLKALQSQLGQPIESTSGLLAAAETAIGERLTVKQEQQLAAAAARNTIGPSITDTPIRQVVYFGNNAQDQSGKPVYGMLASYDDESYTSFWRELELGPEQQEHIPTSADTQPLEGPRIVPKRMIKMLRKQLAELHFGPSSD